MTIDYKQEFFNFLREHNAYEEYIREFEKYNKNETFDLYFLPNEYPDYVVEAFAWDSTELGSEYWEYIDEKWYEHYESFENKV